MDNYSPKLTVSNVRCEGKCASLQKLSLFPHSTKASDRIDYLCEGDRFLDTCKILIYSTFGENYTFSLSHRFSVKPSIQAINTFIESMAAFAGCWRSTAEQLLENYTQLIVHYFRLNTANCLRNSFLQNNKSRYAYSSLNRSVTNDSRSYCYLPLSPHGRFRRPALSRIS